MQSNQTPKQSQRLSLTRSILTIVMVGTLQTFATGCTTMGQMDSYQRAQMINAIGNYVQDDINQKQARQNQINQQMNAVIMSRQTRPFQNIQQFQRTPSAQYPQPVPTQQVQQPMYQPAPIKWNSGY